MNQIETSDFMVPTIFITPKFSSTFSPSFLHNLGWKKSVVFFLDRPLAYN